MAPMARYASEILKQEVEESVKDLVPTPPSLPPSDSDSSSDGTWKGHKDGRSTGKSIRRKYPVSSSKKGTRVLKGSLKEATKLSESSMTVNDTRDRAPTLMVLHTTDSDFKNVVAYKTYCHRVRSQTYNEKMAACTCKYTTRTETLMKVYKFDDRNSIRPLRVFAQFKRACDSNGVSENMALCIMLKFSKDRLASSLTARTTLVKDKGVSARLPKAGEEQKSTYVEVVNYLLKSYATDSNIAKATSNKARLKKTWFETSKQFGGLLRSKVSRCGKAYLEDCTKGVCNDGLPASI